MTCAHFLPNARELICRSNYEAVANSVKNYGVLRIEKGSIASLSIWTNRLKKFKAGHYDLVLSTNDHTYDTLSLLNFQADLETDLTSEHFSHTQLCCIKVPHQVAIRDDHGVAPLVECAARKPPSGHLCLEPQRIGERGALLWPSGPRQPQFHCRTSSPQRGGWPEPAAAPYPAAAPPRDAPKL